MGIESAADFFRRIIGYDNMVYNLLSPHLNGGSVLSVGCGDGRIESELKKNRGIKITGVEVTMYNAAKIPIKLYNGKKLPFKDGVFDKTLFVYMLHHTENIVNLLEEAKRVTRKEIIILDHIYGDFFSKALLKAYDYSVNIPYKMPMPFNFLMAREWNKIFSDSGFSIKEAEVISPLNVFFRLGIRK